ncbi:hypothetical protein V8E51_007975 [Hyaloscypha variabilis]
MIFVSVIAMSYEFRDQTMVLLSIMTRKKYTNYKTYCLMVLVRQRHHIIQATHRNLTSQLATIYHQVYFDSLAMETERSFDSDYDSDEPSILGSARRPTDSDDDSDEPLRLRRPKRPAASDEEDEGHQAYGMQDIVDEMQERIYELGQQLTVSKREILRGVSDCEAQSSLSEMDGFQRPSPSLGHNANVALGALAVKHTSLMKTKIAIQEELSSVKDSVSGRPGCTNTEGTIEQESMAANSEAERENRELREQLRRVNNGLRLKEVAAVEFAETHKQRLKAREDQIGIINAENIKNEAWALKTEWETWCKTKRLSLNRKTRVITEGDIQFTDVETEMAVEIIRLSDSKNETLFSNFIWKARPNLEYQGYPTDPLPDSKTKEIIATHDFIQKKLPLKLNDACFAVRKYLWSQRRQVPGCIRSHPYYGRYGRQARLRMNQECVDFFDRQFTFQVAKLVSSHRWSPGKGVPTMSLRGNEDTASLTGVMVGSYQIDDLKQMDEKVWRALVK